MLVPTVDANADCATHAAHTLIGSVWTELPLLDARLTARIEDRATRARAVGAVSARRSGGRWRRVSPVSSAISVAGRSAP